jgi:transcriptional regulator with XRE-family HTH domain
MSEFRLTGTELSSKSGVSRNTISAFRQGGQSLTVDNLEKLLGAMPEEARRYFFSQLQNTQCTPESENLSHA